MTEFFQQLINGLALGSILALIALGYTMVYGILRFINFAHGDVFMLGAFAGFYLAPKIAAVLPLPSIAGALVVHGNFHGRLRRARRDHRTARLPPVAETAQTHRAHHRHRRFAFSGIRRAISFLAPRRKNFRPFCPPFRSPILAA